MVLYKCFTYLLACVTTLTRTATYGDNILLGFKDSNNVKNINYLNLELPYIYTKMKTSFRSMLHKVASQDADMPSR